MEEHAQASRAYRGKHARPGSTAQAKVLSIAVPSYNVERYLADSLASYCAAGVDDRLEVIVVDDGSTDLTPSIAHEFARLYPTLFKVVTKTNGGHGSAINAGIDAATGTYFRIIDGDDRINSINIESLLDELEDSEADLVVDQRRDVYMDTSDTKLLTLPDDLPKGQAVPFESVCLHPELEFFFMIHMVSARTDLLRKARVHLLEHTFYVDIEYIVKAASQAKTIQFLDLEVCNYYLGNAEQSVAPANYVKRWGDHSRVTEELLRFATETPFEGVMSEFVESRVRLLVNTHYNIALIYDDDRKRGLERAKAFHKNLHERYPSFAEATEKRYRQALVLHYLGFDVNRLDRLMGRR